MLYRFLIIGLLLMAFGCSDGSRGQGSLYTGTTCNSCSLTGPMLDPDTGVTTYSWYPVSICNSCAASCGTYTNNVSTFCNDYFGGKCEAYQYLSTGTPSEYLCYNGLFYLPATKAAFGKTPYHSSASYCGGEYTNTLGELVPYQACPL